MNPKKYKSARRTRSTSYIEVNGHKVIPTKVTDPNFIPIVTKFKGYHQKK